MMIVQPPTSPTLPPADAIAPPLAGWPWLKSHLLQPSRNFNVASRICAVAVGFFIPLSTSIAEILIVIFAVCWLGACHFRARFACMARNPLTFMTVGLFAAMALSLVYTAAPVQDGLRCLLKYRELLYIPLLLTAFQYKPLREWSILSFLAGSMCTVALSYYERYANVDIGLKSLSENVVFKDRIIHSLLLAFASYLLAVLWVDRPRFRWLTGLLLCATVANILYLVQGRTGYLVLAALTALFVFENLPRQRPVWVIAGLLLVGAAVYLISPSLQERIDLTWRQLNRQLEPGEAHLDEPRLQFFQRTLQLVAAHPLLGTGIGSFEDQYRNLKDGQGVPFPPHSVYGYPPDPHSEYLMLAAQIGLPGAAWFVCLLWMQWQAAARLTQQSDRLVARGAVLTFAVGCLFNSLLLGFTGGLFFAWFTGLAFSQLSDPSCTPAEPGMNRPDGQTIPCLPTAHSTSAAA